jgi:uncharacterized protein (TIGR02301 family)
MDLSGVINAHKADSGFEPLEPRAKARESPRMKKTGFHALLLSLALAGGTSAAQSGLPPRGPDYFRDAADLARVLGAAHAIRVRCNGRDDQYWRRYMADMLAYEAPESGNLRSSLVREFNESFSDTSEDYLVCDPVAVAAESRFAEDGQKIATRLATHYFPKRERTGKGFE